MRMAAVVITAVTLLASGCGQSSSPESSPSIGSTTSTTTVAPTTTVVPSTTAAGERQIPLDSIESIMLDGMVEAGLPRTVEECVRSGDDITPAAVDACATDEELLAWAQHPRTVATAGRWLQYIFISDSERPELVACIERVTATMTLDTGALRDALNASFRMIDVWDAVGSQLDALAIESCVFAGLPALPVDGPEVFDRVVSALEAEGVDLGPLVGPLPILDGMEVILVESDTSVLVATYRTPGRQLLGISVSVSPGPTGVAVVDALIQAVITDDALAADARALTEARLGDADDAWTSPFGEEFGEVFLCSSGVRNGAAEVALGAFEALEILAAPTRLGEFACG